MKKITNYQQGGSYTYWYLVAILFGLSSMLCAQSPAIDSLKMQLQSARGIERIELMNDVGQQLIPFDKTQALKYIYEAKNLSESVNYKRGVAHAYYNLGVEAARRSIYDSAIIYTQQSLDLSTGIGDEELMGMTWNMLGGIRSYQGLYLEARKAYLESEKIKIARGDISGQIITVYNLVVLAVQLKHYKEAEALYDKIFQLSGKVGKWENYEFYYSYGLGEVALAQGQFDRARVLLEKAFELQKVQKISIRVKALLKGYLGKVWVGLKDYDKALTFLNEALTALRAIEAQQEVAKTQLSISEALHQKGQLSQALDTAEQAYQIALNIEDLDLLHDATLQLAELHQIAGNIRKSNQFYQKHLVYRDSVFGVERTKEISRLEAFYENEVKEQEIVRLTQENNIKNLQTQNQRTWLWAIGITLFLLAILAALLYRANNLKTRTNELLNKQKLAIEAHNDAMTAQNQLISRHTNTLERMISEKEVLLREIHHRTKNNLNIIESLLNMQTRHLEDKDARYAVVESRNRVQTISLIHQQLSDNHLNTSLNMEDYLSRMADKIEHSILPNHVKFQMSLIPFEMSVEKVVPLALLINEAIINAVKYAFPQGQDGTISLHLCRQEDNRLSLAVSDDGIGYHHGPNYGKPRKNFQLIRGLARQLNAELNIANNHGTTIRIAFENKSRIEALHWKN